MKTDMDEMDEVVSEEHLPEAVRQEIQAAKQQIEQFGAVVAQLERQAQTITVNDDVQEEVALLFITGCQQTFNNIENYRKEKVQPHNAVLSAVNGGTRPWKKVLQRLISAADGLRSEYVTRKQAAIDAENRRRIAEAEAARVEKERKEREAREEAERKQREIERLEAEQRQREYEEELAKLQAEQKLKDDLAAAQNAEEAARKMAEAKAEQEERERKAEEARQATLAEQERLAKQAAKLEAKADIAAASASMVSPEITLNSSLGIRTIASGSRVSTKEEMEPYFLNGMPIWKDASRKAYVDYYLDDERLPEGLPARYFVLDLAKVLKDVKNDVPVPGFGLRVRHKTRNLKS